jgi:hypothetical protein
LNFYEKEFMNVIRGINVVRKFLVTVLCFIGITNAADVLENSNIEYLDAARSALKTAYESGAVLKAPYEYGKAKGFYNMAVEESSNFNVDKSNEAAKKSIEWSLKAIEKASQGETK